MNILVLYFSKGGNTRTLARAVAQGAARLYLTLLRCIKELEP